VIDRKPFGSSATFPMQATFGIAYLKHNPVRTAISAVSIGFPVMLIFLQMGFLSAVQTTATLTLEQLNFDLLVRSPDYQHLSDSRVIEQAYLRSLQNVPGVQCVMPFQVTLASWRNPTMVPGHWDFDPDQVFRNIILMAIDPAHDVFLDQEIQQRKHLLRAANHLLIDRKTKSDYGPRENGRFGDSDTGVSVEVNGKQMTIAGSIELGTGMAANGAALVSLEAYDRLLPTDDRNFVSMGLIKLDPAITASQAEQIRDRWLSSLKASEATTSNTHSRPPVDILTRSEVLDFELNRWVNETPIGAIFRLGVAVAMIVAVAIVYMLLARSVQTNMGEYATLLAMGYSHRYLYFVVVQQAIVLSVVSFIPAWFASLALYYVVWQFANITITMTVGRTMNVFLITMAVCLASAAIALRKLKQADPADKF
jgi:putative ABC transport system permease protein